MKRLFTMVLGAATLVAVQGCSKKAALYLGGPPGPAAQLSASNSDLTMKIGDSVGVGVRAEDAVGNVTSDAVSLSACASVAAVTGSGSSTDWTTTAYIKGAAVGTSCVLAQAAGMTDTILVTVGPAGVDIVGPDTLLSGTGDTYTATFYDGSGSTVTGTVPLMWSSASAARLAIGEPTGAARARSPGGVDVQLYAPGGANAIKSVVVVTGVFGGTLSATSGQPGGLITVSRASDGEQFDDDTQVKLGGYSAFVDSYLPNTLVFAIPATGSTASQTLGFSNLGPGQVAQNGSFTPTLAASDKYQPGNVDNACNVPPTIPDFDAVKSASNAVYIVHDGQTESSSCIDGGGAAMDHWFTFTSGATGVTDLVATWTLSGDYDLVICDTAAKVATNGDCEYGYSGNSNDETMTGVALAPNTKYWFAFEEWDGSLGINNVKLVLTKK